jgi:hypothetical protein
MAQIGNGLDTDSRAPACLPAAPRPHQVVDKVRAQLSKLERRTLSALIVINVHARWACIGGGWGRQSSEIYRCRFGGLELKGVKVLGGV